MTNKKRKPARVAGTPATKSKSSWQLPAMNARVAAAIYFVLALLYFMPALLPGQMIGGVDYIKGGIYFHEFIQEQMRAGALPKWVPYIYGGLPMISNPGSSYYPPYLLGNLLLPLELVLPFVFILQFGLAGLGTYVLTRELGCRRWVSFVSGLLYQFNGLLISNLKAGHDGRIVVATLAPLFLALLHRGVRTGSVAAFAGATLVLGGALTSFQIQSNYYLLLAGAIWGVFLLIYFGHHRTPKVFATRLVLGLASVALAFGIAAIDYVPFAKYVDASPRGGDGRGYEYSTTWSMPPAELMGIAVPEQAGILTKYKGDNPFKLHTEYVGALVIVLLALGFYYSRRNRYWWCFLGLTAFFLTIVLGKYTPLYQLYYSVLPGTTKFRAPSIAFFLISLALIAMAAITLEAIAARLDARAQDDKPIQLRSPPLMIIAGVIAATIVVALVMMLKSMGMPHTSHRLIGWIRFLIFLIIMSGTFVLWLRARINVTTVAFVLAIVSVLDLGIIGRRFFELHDGPDTIFGEDDLVSFMGKSVGASRAWVLPTYKRADGNWLMHFKIPQIAGEHPNMLQTWNDFIGVDDENYVDFHNVLNGSKFIRAASIRYLFAGHPINLPGFSEIYHGSAYVYRVEGAFPPAYLVSNVVVTADRDSAFLIMQRPEFDLARNAVVAEPLPVELPATPLKGGARMEQFTPDEVQVGTRANQPALLVLTQNYYRGWQAEIDGKPAPIIRTNHTFRGVVVPAGDHTVVFRYRPPELYAGLRITLVSWLLLAIIAAGLLFRRYRRNEHAA